MYAPSLRKMQFNEAIEHYLEKIRNICLEYNYLPIVIATDANAKSIIWNSEVTDNRGERIEDVMSELVLEVANQANK